MALETLPVPSPARPQIRVAVVDDNPGFRETLASLLGTEELLVVGAVGRGSDAVDLVRSTEPDVVLMDVRMPEMNGIEATRLLKSTFPEVGIVALTGVDDQDAVREMLVAGASCYVLKDSDSDEIFHAIRQAARRRRDLVRGHAPRDRRAHRGPRTRATPLRQLELAQEALLERAARRHELVSRLGHELRTPVTVILGMAQTLSKGTGTSEQREEMLGALVMRAQGLARLVSRLEGVVEAGLTEYTDVVDVATRSRGSPSASVRDARPADARAPEPRRRPILEELVENGLEFSNEGSPVIVESRAGDRDRGAGDRPGHRDLGGRPRADLRAARAGGGPPHPDPSRRGPGLTVARMSARAMDGDVTLERSGPGLGVPVAGLDEPLRDGAPPRRPRVLLEPAHVHVQQDPHPEAAREHRAAAVRQERSGIRVIGMIPITIPMFTNIWIANMIATPVAR